MNTLILVIAIVIVTIYHGQTSSQRILALCDQYYSFLFTKFCLRLFVASEYTYIFPILLSLLLSNRK